VSRLVSRRACVSPRGALLRGVFLALALWMPFALMSRGDAPPQLLVAAAAAIGTVCAGVVVAALVERAYARRGDAGPVGALLVMLATAPSIPIALAQGRYAEAVLRGGKAEGLAQVEALASANGAATLLGQLIASVVMWGLPCALAAIRRIRPHADPEERWLLAVVAASTLVAVPGLLVVEVVYVAATLVDERLGRG
jgi:hypothetical protein